MIRVRLNEKTSFVKGKGWCGAPVIVWLEENVGKINDRWLPRSKSWELLTTNGAFPFKGSTEIFSYVEFSKPIDEVLMLEFCLHFGVPWHVEIDKRWLKKGISIE